MGTVDDTYDLRPAAPAVPRRTGSADVVGVDSPCPSCGYNLRGLARGSRCPECGVFPPPRFHDELQFANREWVGKLAWGMAGTLGGFALFPLMILAMLLLSQFVAVLVAAAMASCVTAAGLWLLTWREPVAVARGAWSLRGVLRMTAVAASGGEIFFQMCVAGLLGHWIIDDWSGVILLVYLGLLGVRTIVLAYFLENLAWRIPNDELVNRVVPASYAVVAACGLGLFMVPALGSGGAMVDIRGWVCVASPLILPAAVYGWGMTLLWGFVRDLRACAAEARCRS